MKEKLKELLIKADENAAGKMITDYKDAVDDIADYLLANGVIVSPCKVGDVVWYELYGEANSAVIYSCIGALTSHGFVITDANAKDSSGLEVAFSGNCLGKTVFLSREEAEAALKGEDDEQRKAD